MERAAAPELEFSRKLPLAEVLSRPRTLTVTAAPAECGALARRFDLVGIGSLTASVRLLPAAEGGVRMRARLKAEVIQSCVVTLEPVAAVVDEEFSLLYVPMRPAGVGEEEEIAMDDDETVEPLPAGALDVGEAVAQQLSLALDPYPRAPGAPRVGDVPPPDGEGAPTPFEFLDRLRGPSGRGRT